MAMRLLCDLSGPWVGFWVQGPRRGDMSLKLGFAAGKITGDGSDAVGGFSIRGSYSADGQVSMVKRYAWHRVKYKGKWDGQMIFGLWEIKYEDAGEFEIWPEQDLQALSMAVEVEERQLVGANPSTPHRSNRQ